MRNILINNDNNLRGFNDNTMIALMQFPTWKEYLIQEEHYEYRVSLMLSHLNNLYKNT